MRHETSQKTRAHPLRLLVVDDNPLVRGMIVEQFEQVDYEVEEAGCAEQALDLAQLVRWDGLVLDVDMPGMNGLELYTRLLLHNGVRRLPVIFFSGSPHPALELSLATTPWARLVMKPCGGLRLVSLMEQCLLAVRQEADDPKN